MHRNVELTHEKEHLQGCADCFKSEAEVADGFLRAAVADIKKTEEDLRKAAVSNESTLDQLVELSSRLLALRNLKEKVLEVEYQSKWSQLGQARSQIHRINEELGIQERVQ